MYTGIRLLLLLLKSILFPPWCCCCCQCYFSFSVHRATFFVFVIVRLLLLLLFVIIVPFFLSLFLCWLTRTLKSDVTIFPLVYSRRGFSLIHVRVCIQIHGMYIYLHFYIIQIYIFFSMLALFTIFTIDYISLDTTFLRSSVLYISRWILNSEIVDMHWIAINSVTRTAKRGGRERERSGSIGERTHVQKFNLHSFRFVDFLTFISICPTMRISPVIEQRFLKRFHENFHSIFDAMHSKAIGNSDFGLCSFSVILSFSFIHAYTSWVGRSVGWLVGRQDSRLRKGITPKQHTAHANTQERWIATIRDLSTNNSRKFLRLQL